MIHHAANSKETEIITGCARKAIAGYVGSAAVGLFTARWLARPSRIGRYRPGLLGQAFIVTAATFMGGGAIAMRAAFNSSTRLIDADGEVTTQAQLWW
jgi:hypothetical protein